MDADAHPWPQHGSGVPPAADDAPAEGRLRRGFGAVGFVLDALRRRRSGRIGLWSIVVGLTLGGVYLIAYPFITNFWADRIQDGLQDDFAALQANADPRAGGFTAANRPGEGQALTRLRIPKLGVNVIVVEGTSGNALRAGAGHFYETPLPGEPGNVAIAGHRTGYGEPFRHIEKLRDGDQIILETPFATYVYKVRSPFEEAFGTPHPNPWIVKPTDLSVKAETADSVVTLVSCDPPGTSKNRLIVRGWLVKTIDG